MFKALLQRIVLYVITRRRIVVILKILWIAFCIDPSYTVGQQNSGNLLWDSEIYFDIFTLTIYIQEHLAL